MHRRGSRLHWCSTPAPDPSEPTAEPLTSATNAALQMLAPADVILDGARTAAEGLAGADGERRLRGHEHGQRERPDGGRRAARAGRGRIGRRSRPVLAERVAASSLRLRPRLSLIVGPCVYLRREALELVGSLDSDLS